MPKVVALKEIRHDEQRFNLEDVCAFLLARDLDNLSDRMAKLAREHALETLKTVFEHASLSKSSKLRELYGQPIGTTSKIQ